MRRITIDSSVFLANLHIQDTFHKTTHTFFECLSNEELVIIPTIVPFEVGNALLRYRNLFDPGAFLDHFSDFELVPIDMEFIRGSLPILSHVALKAHDGLLVTTASMYKSLLITWDKQLLKEARKIIQALTPEEYLGII